MKTIIILLFTSISFVLLSQNLAFTEDFGEQPMDDSQQNNEYVLMSSSGDLRTYDYKCQPFGGSTCEEFELLCFSNHTYPSFRIPTSQNGDWNITNAAPSVYQAHWITRKVLDVFSNELGVNFSRVHVAANCSGSNSLCWPESRVSGDTYVAFGSQDKDCLDKNTPPNTKAHYDIIGHELGHALLFSESKLSILFNVDAAIHEAFSDLTGVIIEGEIENEINWEIGDMIPNPNARNLAQPEFDCIIDAIADNSNDEHTIGEVIGHMFYKLVTGDESLSITPVDIKEVHSIILAALGNTAKNTTYDILKIRTLRTIENSYGPCSDTYKSFVNAFNYICLTDPEGVVECCETASTFNIPEDMTINTDMVFDGNVIVQSGATLTLGNPAGSGSLGTKLSFPYKASLQVESGATLIIESQVKMNSCHPFVNWQGVIMDDDSNAEFRNLTITNATQGIKLNKINSDEFICSNVKFENCDMGIYLSGASNIKIGGDEMAGSQGSFNWFVDCEQGIVCSGGQATITRNRIDNSSTSISIGSSQGKYVITENLIFYNSIGIRVVNSEALIDDNELFSLDFDGQVGIFSALSSCDIINNTRIDANATGILSAYTIDPFANKSVTISGNEIDVTGNYGPGFSRADGIRSIQDNNLMVSNNKVTGNGLKTGINCSVGTNNTIERNDVGATNSENGIAVTAGSLNFVQFNDVQNEPHNGILNTSSIKNTYHDNDISAAIQGLSIEPKSVGQTITCNRFCSGWYDLNIESNLNRPVDHYFNQFKQNVAKVRAPGLSANDLLESRFHFSPNQSETVEDCGELVYEITDSNDPSDLFRMNMSNPQSSCEEDSGSNLQVQDPNSGCELQARLAAEGRWQEIQQLVASGLFISDCGTIWCKLLEIGAMENQLNAALRNNQNLDFISALSQVQAVAAAQLSQMNNSSTNSGNEENSENENLWPCDPDLEEIYARTYKNKLNQIGGQPIPRQEIEYLLEVASYCHHEYGDVVEWAIGILAVDGIYKYDAGDCHRDIEQREVIIVNNEADLQFSCYPNPANNEVSITLNKNLEEGIISIRDILGNLILRTDINPEFMTYKIGTSNLISGYYIITLESQDIVRLSQPLIIHH